MKKYWIVRAGENIGTVERTKNRLTITFFRGTTHFGLIKNLLKSEMGCELKEQV